jgi:hypothetical protein
VTWAGWWFFSPGTLVSSTNNTDLHDITEILLKVELNTININCIVVEITCWDLLQIPDIKIIY